MLGALCWCEVFSLTVTYFVPAFWFVENSILFAADTQHLLSQIRDTCLHDHWLWCDRVILFCFLNCSAQIVVRNHFATRFD